MESQSYNLSPNMSGNSAYAVKAKEEAFDEVQILCNLAYRAVYGKNLKNMILKDQNGSGEDEERIEERNLVKKLIFTENWKLQQLLSTVEFEEAYQAIFADRLKKIIVPFCATDVLQKILRNFGAQISPVSNDQDGFEIETSKNNLKGIIKEVTGIREKLEKLSSTLHTFKDGDAPKSIENLSSICLKLENDESLDKASSDRRRDGSCKVSNSESKESENSRELDVFLSEDEGKCEDGAKQGRNGNKYLNSRKESLEVEDFFKLKKKRHLLKKSVSRILKNWILANIENPYPSEDKKQSLCEETGLTRNQLQNWFTNTRKRFLKPIKQEGEKMETKQSLDMREKALEQNLSIQRQDSDTYPSVYSGNILAAKTQGRSSKLEAVSFHQETSHTQGQMSPTHTQVHDQVHIIQNQMQIPQVLPQNYPLFVQGQSFPLGYTRAPGMHPQAISMANFSTVPMQQSHSQWVAPNQQHWQQMPFQSAPQYPATKPVQVIPVYMVMQPQPKIQQSQPISSVPMNSYCVMPVTAPSFNSDFNKAVPINTFAPLKMVAANSIYNSVITSTPLPLSQIKETNIGFRPELHLESSYGYKKIKM